MQTLFRSILFALLLVTPCAKLFAQVVFTSNFERCERIGNTGYSHEDVQQIADAYIKSQGIPSTEAEFRLLLEHVATSIGCPISSPPQRSAPKETTGCADGYCSNVRYCGPGNSTTSSLWLPPSSDALNRICAAHDACYSGVCQHGLLCTWSLQSGVHDCDARFHSDAANLFLAEGGNIRVIDAIIVAIALAAKAAHVVDPFRCGTAKPCGSDLCDGAGVCRTPIAGASCQNGNSCPNGSSCFVDTQQCVVLPGGLSGWYCQSGSNSPPGGNMLGSCSIHWLDRARACIQRAGPGQTGYGCGAEYCLCSILDPTPYFVLEFNPPR